MEFYQRISIHDFDGNILHTDTPYYLKDIQNNTPVLITQKHIRSDPKYYDKTLFEKISIDDIYSSVQHFRDFHHHPRHRGPDGLLKDIQEALDIQAFAPSFHKLIQALVKGNLCTILTARGHTPDNLARGLILINDQCLTDAQKKEQTACIKENYNLKHMSDATALRTYFEQYIYYIPVGNKQFCKSLQINIDHDDAAKKIQALERYLHTIGKVISEIKQQSLATLLQYDKKISVGFSDDTSHTIISMLDTFIKWKEEKHFPMYKFRAYHTGVQSDKNLIMEGLGSEKTQQITITHPTDLITKYAL